MKRYWMLGAAAAILFSMGCENQKPDLAEDFSDLSGVDEKSDQFSNKMKLLGSLDYGQTSPSVKYHNPPKYRAYKFGGQKGDQVIIDVASANGDSYAWLTDNNFKVIAKNDDSGDSLNSHIEAKLPGNKNPDIITYYIIFSEYSLHDATFHVSLAQKACVQNTFCIQGAHWDTKQCKCVTDQQTCGGIAGIQCPAGQKCVDNPNDSCDPNNGGADCGGICVACVDNVLCVNGSHWDSNACGCVPDQQTCGGIAGIQCPAGQKCVDNPNDSCDPNNGGRDCGGICVACVDNVACVRGSHWDQNACGCVPDQQTCGGIANIQCPAGQVCVDNPNDSCDPNNGGADCGGICVTQTDCSAVRCASGTTCVNCFGGARCLAAGQVCAF